MAEKKDKQSQRENKKFEDFHDQMEINTSNTNSNKLIPNISLTRNSILQNEIKDASSENDSNNLLSSSTNISQVKIDNFFKPSKKNPFTSNSLFQQKKEINESESNPLKLDDYAIKIKDAILKDLEPKLDELRNLKFSDMYEFLRLKNRRISELLNERSLLANAFPLNQNSNPSRKEKIAKIDKEIKKLRNLENKELLEYFSDENVEFIRKDDLIELRKNFVEKEDLDMFKQKYCDTLYAMVVDLQKNMENFKIKFMDNEKEIISLNQSFLEYKNLFSSNNNSYASKDQMLNLENMVFNLKNSFDQLSISFKRINDEFSNFQLNNLSEFNSLKEINKNEMNEYFGKMNIISNDLEDKVNFLNDNHNSMVEKFRNFYNEFIEFRNKFSENLNLFNSNEFNKLVNNNLENIISSKIANKIDCLPNMSMRSCINCGKNHTGICRKGKICSICNCINHNDLECIFNKNLETFDNILNNIGILKDNSSDTSFSVSKYRKYAEEVKKMKMKYNSASLKSLTFDMDEIKNWNLFNNNESQEIKNHNKLFNLSRINNFNRNVSNNSNRNSSWNNGRNFRNFNSFYGSNFGVNPFDSKKQNF